MRSLAPPIEINKEYVYFLDVNGMSGRHIKLPSKSLNSRRQIVVFGGFLSSAEKHFGLLDYLRQFGEVNYIDLPGYGGMDSLFEIGEFPMCDNYGDYIYSVLKTLKSISMPSIVCLGSSVIYVVNFMKRHPAARRWVRTVIHIEGIDADVSKATYGELSRASSSLLKLASSKPSINKLLYRRLIGGIEDKELSEDEKSLLEHLVSCNDIRTHMSVLNEQADSSNLSTDLEESLKKNILLIGLDSAYKNFKLYDQQSIAEILPKQLGALLR